MKKGQEAAVVTRMANLLSLPKANTFHVIKNIASIKDAEEVASYYLQETGM